MNINLSDNVVPDEQKHINRYSKHLPIQRTRRV